MVNVDICKGEGWGTGADKSHIDIEADILTWDYQRESRIVNIDMVWASPPCTAYSCARNCSGGTAHPELDKSDSLVKRIVEIIEYVDPRVAAIENPHGGPHSLWERFISIISS